MLQSFNCTTSPSSTCFFVGFSKRYSIEAYADAGWKSYQNYNIGFISYQLSGIVSGGGGGGMSSGVQGYSVNIVVH
jgi:hypothetical protein